MGNFESTKKSDHILEIQGLGYFVIINSSMLLLRLGGQITEANYIKNQKQLSSRLSTVMFRGTPCRCQENSSFVGHPVGVQKTVVSWDTL